MDCDAAIVQRLVDHSRRGTRRSTRRSTSRRSTSRRTARRSTSRRGTRRSTSRRSVRRSTSRRTTRRSAPRRSTRKTTRKTTSKDILTSGLDRAVKSGVNNAMKTKYVKDSMTTTAARELNKDLRSSIETLISDAIKETAKPMKIAVKRRASPKRRSTSRRSTSRRSTSRRTPRCTTTCRIARRR